MDVRQWPLAAVALDRDGVPWYPFTPPGDSLVLFVDRPRLLAGTWAPVPPEYADSPQVRLDDEAVVAELLYFDPDPDAVVGLTDDAELLDHIGKVLARVGSDARTLAGWVGSEYGDRLYDLHANARMQACRQFAHGLFGAPGEPR